MKTRLITLTLLVLFQLGLVAQTRTLVKANYKYENLAFSEAIDLYERYLEKRFNEEAAYKLANAYRFTQQYEKAEEWYGGNLEFVKTQPKTALFYAQMLQANGKYKLAEEWYRNYLDLDPGNQLAKKGIIASQKAAEMAKKPSIYQTTPVSFNTEYADYAPTIIDGQMVFVSDRNTSFGLSRTDNLTGRSYTEQFSANFEGPTNFIDVDVLKVTENSRYHEGPIVSNPSGSMLVATRNYSNSEREEADQSVHRLKLVAYVYNDFSLKYEEAVDLSFCSPKFNTAQPSFSADGSRLYFSSDRPGGYGGADIWYVNINEDGSFSEPKNLGAGVNTAGNEMFPFVNKDGSLYVASNGWPGLGGLDIHKWEWNKSTKSFSNRWNPGTGLNSSMDDFAILFTGENKGYISSNRSGGNGSDDIYYFEPSKPIVELYARYANDSSAVEGVEMRIFSNDKLVGFDTTDAYGKIVYPLDEKTDYKIVLSSKRGAFGTKELSTDNLIQGKTYEYVFYLDIIPTETVRVKGLLVEDQSKLPMPNATVRLVNLENGQEQVKITNETGFYYARVKPNTNYQVIASRDGYKSDSLSFSTDTIENNAFLPVMYLKGGEALYNLTFKHIYFDYNKASLRDASIVELLIMLDIMKYSPELRVEISAHTDSRGSLEYNQKLSDKRAASVRQYLVDNGIDPSRMTSKGYGESRLTNKCSDGVKCSEEEHQKNRRVEFTVIDENNKTIYESKAFRAKAK